MGATPEKRKPEDGAAGEQPPAKKMRADAGEVGGSNPAAIKKPALPALDALAKAKAVLQKQKDLAAKLKNMPKLNATAGGAAAVAASAASAAAAKAGNAAVTTASAAAAKAGAAGMPQVAQLLQQQAVQRALEVAGQIKAAAGEGVGGSTGGGGAAAPKFTPGALRLNEKGEEVDEAGNVVKHKYVEVSTFKVNVKQQKLEEFAAMEKETAAELAAGDDSWMDLRMGKGGKRRERRGGFQVSARGRGERVRSERTTVFLSVFFCPVRPKKYFFSAQSVESAQSGRKNLRLLLFLYSSLDQSGVTQTYASYTLSRELLLSCCNFYACKIHLMFIKTQPEPTTPGSVTRR
jgi:hypothetical protein